MKNNFQKTNIDGFVKDMKTNAILNTETGEFHAIRLQRQKKQEQEQIKLRLSGLEQDVADIKESLGKILEALTK